MIRYATRERSRLTWRAFPPRHGTRITLEIARGARPSCPCCGDCLESRTTTRMSKRLPLGSTGYDLDCRACRRFWCIVRHSARSRRLLRMRRFAAAIRAVEITAPSAAPA